MVAELSSCGQMVEGAGGSCIQFTWTDGGGGRWYLHSVHVDRWWRGQVVAELSSCGQMVEGAGGSCTQFIRTDGGGGRW